MPCDPTPPHPSAVIPMIACTGPVYCGSQSELGAALSELLSQQHKSSGEMAQQLRALTTFLEEISSIPSTHMAANNHL
ncbi:Lipogenin [Cricetulus griseus]|uniref:Lipogenin n=1 Tax=Cricetulus griseus TaxID=10029 RepID=A0A061I7Q2_CRIGR|nr:Lipogenin [Cricetulus griseus]